MTPQRILLNMDYMEKNLFSHDLFTEITSKIENQLNQTEGPYYAAFDADGTLWDNDLGEQFFQYQIDHSNLDTLRQLDPWDHYNSGKKVDPEKAYLWLAQISQNQKFDQVQSWAKAAVDSNPLKEFESQKKLISWLQSKNVEVFIVTASVQWAVVPAAEKVGVKPENVIGIQTEIVDGIVTEKQKGPITWRQGKAEALLARTNNVKPVFCSGNTYGDIALLETAHLPLAVQTQTENNGLFEEESKLLSFAKEKQWLTHHFFA